MMEFLNHFFITYTQYVFEPLYGLINGAVSSFDLTFNQRKFITFGLLFLVPILLMDIKFIHKIILSFGLSVICIAIFEISKEKGYINTELPNKLALYILFLLILFLFVRVIRRLFK